MGWRDLKAWQKGALISGGTVFFFYGLLGMLLIPGLNEGLSFIIFPLMIPLFIFLILVGVDMKSLGLAMSSASPMVSKLSMLTLVTIYFALIGAIAGHIISKILKTEIKEK